MRYGPFSSKPFRVGVARFSQVGPTVDGDLADWPADLPTVVIDNESQINRTSGVWSAADASARVRAWFTPNTFFLAAEVTDDAPMHNPNPALRMYQGDAVQVFLGFRGPSQRTVINKEFEYQLGFAPTTSGGEPAAFWFHKDVPIEGANIKVRKTDAGCVIEASVPLKSLDVPDLPLKPGMVLAFDVTLDDLDADDWAPAGNDPGRSLSWNGGSMNWIDPSGWGALALREAGPDGGR